MESYNYAGTDQQLMAPKLAFLNKIMSSITTSYSALHLIVKVDGQPGNEQAQRILTTAMPAFVSLFEAIEALGSTRRGE